MNISEISSALRMSADSLAREILPGGRYEEGGREWKCGAHDSPTGSPISVHVGRGDKQGVCGFWNERRPGGDMLDLIELVYNYSKADAVRWAKQWLGHDDKPPMTRRNLAARRRPNVEVDNDHARIARRIWDNADQMQGAGASYLRHRGIDPAVCLDRELRFARALPYPDGGTFPAIVARVSNPAGELTGVWRIYLKIDGSGKAPVAAPKLGLGSVRGGAVRLGGVWPTIGVAEGIETALACQTIIRRGEGKLLPVWASLSTSGIRGLELPEGVLSVRIYPDADPVKFTNDGRIKPSPGLEAARELTKRLCERGINVRIEPPPVGQDWLDVLNNQPKDSLCDASLAAE